MLKEGGARIISDPALFYVQGTEGPLRSGELDKARAWAEALLSNVSEGWGPKPLRPHPPGSED